MNVDKKTAPNDADDLEYENDESRTNTEWGPFSPEANVNNTQASQQTVEQTMDLAARYRAAATAQAAPKKSAPVTRRFSGIHRPNFGAPNEEPIGEGSDEPEGKPRDSPYWEGVRQGKEQKQKSGDGHNDREDTDDSDPEESGTDEDDDDSSHWDNLMNNINSGDLKTAKSLTVIANAPTAKTQSASDILSNILQWQTHEPSFVQFRKNGALTTEQARNFLEKSKGAGDKSPTKALRAAARNKGLAVNREIKKVLQWCERHGMKSSSAISIMIDTVSKKEDECESFEQRTDRTIEYFMRTKRSDWLLFLKKTSKGILADAQDTALENQPGTIMLQQDHTECEAAWIILSAGVTNTLSYTPKTHNQWIKSYANWLAVDRVTTIGLTRIQGKFQKQKASETIDDLIDRMDRVQNILKNEMLMANMSQDAPNESQSTGNLMASVDPRFAKDMVQHIRHSINHKTGHQTISLAKTVRMLKDSEVRLLTCVSGFYDERDHADKPDRSNTRPRNRNGGKNQDDRGQRQIAKRKLTMEQKHAITNFAKANNKEWSTVTLEEVESSPGGVAEWKDIYTPKAPNAAHPAAHPVAADNNDKKRICRFFEKGNCNKGDQCSFVHANKHTPNKAGVAHQRREASDDEAEDEEDEDEYEAYPTSIGPHPEGWTYPINHDMPDLVCDDSTEPDTQSDSSSEFGEHQYRHSYSAEIQDQDWIEHDTSEDEDESHSQASTSSSSSEMDSEDEPEMQLKSSDHGGEYMDLEGLSTDNICTHTRGRQPRTVMQATEQTADDDHDGQHGMATSGSPENTLDSEQSTTDSELEYYAAVHDPDLEDAEIPSESTSTPDSTPDDTNISMFMSQHRADRKAQAANNKQCPMRQTKLMDCWGPTATNASAGTPEYNMASGDKEIASVELRQNSTTQIEHANALGLARTNQEICRALGMDHMQRSNNTFRPLLNQPEGTTAKKPKTAKAKHANDTEGIPVHQSDNWTTRDDHQRFIQRWTAGNSTIQHTNPVYNDTHEAPSQTYSAIASTPPRQQQTTHLKQGVKRAHRQRMCTEWTTEEVMSEQQPPPATIVDYALQQRRIKEQAALLRTWFQDNPTICQCMECTNSATRCLDAGHFCDRCTMYTCMDCACGGCATRAGRSDDDDFEQALNEMTLEQSHTNVEATVQHVDTVEHRDAAKVQNKPAGQKTSRSYAKGTRQQRKSWQNAKQWEIKPDDFDMTDGTTTDPDTRVQTDNAHQQETRAIVKAYCEKKTAVNTWQNGDRTYLIFGRPGTHTVDWENSDKYTRKVRPIGGPHTVTTPENEHVDSDSSSTHSSSSPRLGDREGMCQCVPDTPNPGSHGCNVYLTHQEIAAGITKCIDCRNWDTCECECDECDSMRHCMECRTGGNQYACECTCDECNSAQHFTKLKAWGPDSDRFLAPQQLEDDGPEIKFTTKNEEAFQQFINDVRDNMVSKRHDDATRITHHDDHHRQVSEAKGIRDALAVAVESTKRIQARELKRQLEQGENALSRRESTHQLMTMDIPDKWENTHKWARAVASIHNWKSRSLPQDEPPPEPHKATGSKTNTSGTTLDTSKGWLKRRAAIKANVHAAGTTHGARRARAFMARVNDMPRRTGVDSYAEISMVLDTIVNPNWPVLEETGIDLRGIGKASTGALVVVPVNYRCGLETEYLTMRVVSASVMPKGLEMLIGTKVQHDHGMTIDAGSSRLTILKSSAIIDTEPVTKIMARQQSRPLNVLELAGGMSPGILILTDLGWRINKWHSSETNAAARSVATAVAAKAGIQIRHIAGLEELSEQDTKEKYDLILASPPCRGFSRAPDDPEGWEGPDGDLFRRCCRIINSQQDKGHKPKIIFENVVIHGKREQDAQSQDEHLGIPFKNLKASECGGTQVRERRIATNICDIDKLRRMQPADPNWVLQPTASTTRRLMPGIMASGSKTREPPIVIDAITKTKRMATIGELERAQGYPDGITAAWSDANTSKEQSTIIGNSWNYHQISRVLRELDPRIDAPGVHFAEEIKDIKMSQEERHWHSMSTAERTKEINQRLQGYTPSKHYIVTKETHNIPYQVPMRERARTTPAREPAARAELKLRLERGHMRLVSYDSRQWISRMFTKGKDRVNPETGLEAIRFLTDLRELNGAIDWPVQWGDECPTIEQMAATYPKSARYFASEDIKDAYEGCQMDQRSQHLLTAATPFEVRASGFTDEELARYSDEPINTLRASNRPLLVQWSGMPQGLASAASFYNVHLADGLNRIFGEMWREMLAIYVDDLLIHGTTYRHCQLRQQLIHIALKALGKDLSTKGDRTIKTYGQIVGLKITKDGIEPDDEVMESLRMELETVPRTRKQAQHLIGVIRYSHTAFTWQKDDLLWYNRDLQPMHQAVATDKFEWDSNCKLAVEHLKGKMKQQPRAHTDPNTMLDKDHCMVIVSDACDDGVGAALWVVNKGDASKVTVEDLQNTKVSTLVAVDSKILDKSQQKWATFEKELYAAYRAMKKWGRLMIQAMQRNTDTQTQKVSIRMDNSTATKQWLDMQNPGIIDFAGPKEMRMMSWAENMAFTRELNMDVQFIPGNMNSLADVISRVATKLGECAARRKAHTYDMTVAHTQVSTFDSQDTEHEGELPEGYKARHLTLSIHDAEEIRRAQLADIETVHKVKTGDVAKCILNDGVDVSPEVSQKIMPWIGRTYFAVTHPETKVQLMYTPISQQRVQWESEDATKILVLHIPNKAQVKLTSAAELFSRESITNDAPEWITRQLELKGQLLSLCHDMQVPHPSVTESVILLKRMGHWPKMLKDMMDHIEFCADCMEDRKHREEAGTGIVAACRLKVAQMDHYLLSKEQARVCGHELILTITCPASQVTNYAAVKFQTALETAKAMWIQWIPYYGVPDLLITDGHPGFGSEIMVHLRSFMGIKGHEIAGSGSKSKTGMVETRHNELTAALSDGFAKGAIQNEQDLLMYLATAKKTHDQDREGNRITPFECLFGQPAASRIDMAMVKPTMQIPDALPEDAKEFCQKIKSYTENLLKISLWKRDDVARTNARRRHQQLGKNATHTHYKMKAGDEVSFQGNLYILGATTGAAVNRPITAEITTKDGKQRKKVQFKDLRPAATPRPANYIRRELPEAGKLVLWEDATHVRAGKVTATNEHTRAVTVHEHAATQGTSVYWLPLWMTADGVVSRAKNAPAGSNAKMTTVHETEIKVIGKLTPTYALEAAMRKEAMAKMQI